VDQPGGQQFPDREIASILSNRLHCADKVEKKVPQRDAIATFPLRDAQDLGGEGGNCGDKDKTADTNHPSLVLIVSE
jgi:hypothetical protein